MGRVFGAIIGCNLYYLRDKKFGLIDLLVQQGPSGMADIHVLDKAKRSFILKDNGNNLMCLVKLGDNLLSLQKRVPPFLEVTKKRLYLCKYKALEHKTGTIRKLKTSAFQ